MGIRNVVYAATSITKEVCKSPYEGDELTRTCTMSESIKVESDTLSGLIDKLGERFGLSIDYIFLAADEGEAVEWFDFDRYETDDCDELTERQTESWKDGNLDVWHAIYSFTIEKRCVWPIDFSEFASAGIKTN